MNEQYLVTPKTSAQILADAQEQKDQQDQALQIMRAESIARPNLLSVVVYFVVSTLVLIAADWSVVLDALNRSAPKINSDFSGQVSQQLAAYGNLPIVSWITIILFWGTVGLGVYTLFWLGMAFFTVARNELIVETAFSNRGHFQERIRVPLIRLLLVGAFLAAVGLTVRYVAPFCAQVFAQGLTNFSGNLVVAVLQMLAGILGGMICLYLLRTIFSYIRHADGIF